jgi:hypothetical protein
MKFIIVIFSLFSFSLFSQNKIIEGTVMDENFIYLKNAHIETQDEKYFTKSDEKGCFKIIIPDSYSNLKVQFVGLHTYLISIDNKSFINAILLNHFLIEFKTLNDEEKFYSKRRKQINKKFKEYLKHN